MVFKDDSTPEQLRAAAIERLTELCPAQMRPLFSPIIQQQIGGMADNQVAELMGDVDKVLAMAQTGDTDGVMGIAKHWGATDAQIEYFIPALGWNGKA